MKYLKDAGVKSIDQEGGKEFLADINLEYNPLLTTVDTSTIPKPINPLFDYDGDGVLENAAWAENTNTIIEETTFTRHSVLDTESEILNQVQDDEIGIMRDILFRYENTSKPTEGVYFNMDANTIQEKIIQSNTNERYHNLKKQYKMINILKKVA